jgi:multiple sugar transport system permease protein
MKRKENKAMAKAETMKVKETISSTLNRRMKIWVAVGSVTLFTLMILSAWLAPFAYMTATSLKTQEQIADPLAPLWPATADTFEFEGETHEVYQVVVGPDNPAWFDANGNEILDEGEESISEGSHTFAIVTRGRESSVFINPSQPDQGLITWIGRWRTLEAAWQFTPEWGNYVEAWDFRPPNLSFLDLLTNTFSIAFFGIIGTVISCTLVAYGFSRFRIPGKGLLFLLLVSTIFLPRIVVTVPTYALFIRFGWVGTWLPLIVPHFFANAYNVFWLRQYLMTIPREMDEAAMIDGAGPLQILRHVIVPQLMPAIITVALFHMVFAFRDFFEPLIYLASTPELQPISVGVQQYNALFGQRPALIQTMALMGLFLPVFIFFFAQRAFTRGIVFTGVEK